MAAEADNEGQPLMQTIFVTSTPNPDLLWANRFPAASPDEFVPTLEESRKQLAVDLAEGILVDLRADHEERGDKCYVGDTNYWIAEDNPLPESLRPSYAIWMCEQVIANKDTWGSTRMHRWIGYIQAILILCGVTGLEWEKDRVRELKKQFPEE